MSIYKNNDIIIGQNKSFIVKTIKSGSQSIACKKCYFNTNACRNDRIKILNNNLTCTQLLGVNGNYFKELEGGL